MRETLAGTFLDGAPILPVSGVTGEGLEALREALAHVADDLPAREDGPWARLPVDRVFASRGFGTVVTGTLLGGALHVGDELVAAPGGVGGRIRGLQVHGEKVETALPHRRVAVNVQGVEREQLRRGHVLVPKGREISTHVLDASIDVIDDAPVPLEDGMRVRVHHGTAEVMARLRLPDPGVLEPGENGAAQVRLEEELALLPGDRFIVRRYSPVVTLAGGQVADLDPPRLRRSEADWSEGVRRLAAADGSNRLRLQVAARGPLGLELKTAGLRLGLDPRELKEALPERIRLLGKETLADESGVDALLTALRKALEAWHARDPLDPGPAPERMRATLAPAWGGPAFRDLLGIAGERGLVDFDREHVRLVGHEAAPQGEDAELLARAVTFLEGIGYEARSSAEVLAAVGAESGAASLLAYADRCGQAVRLRDDTWISGKAWRVMTETLEAEAAAGRDKLGVPRFKELFGVSRKYAIPLLERLDDAGVTRRAGNDRILCRRD